MPRATVSSFDRQSRSNGSGSAMTRILLVEDNEMNRDMLSRRLARRGFEVAVAVDGQQGVDMAAADSPDLILMDMSLPVIDGWEATRQIKADEATRPPSRHRPDRPRHGRRPREGPRGRLRRLRHQARRSGAACWENRKAAGAARKWMSPVARVSNVFHPCIENLPWRVACSPAIFQCRCRALLWGQ